MKPKIYPELMMRVPQLHLNANLFNEWDKLKESIKISSNEFYEQIKDIAAEDLKTLPRPIYHTVWKYFNRAKYRATPYGSFAGCCHLKFHGREQVSEVIVDDHQVLHPFQCWSQTEQIAAENRLINFDTFLLANTSFYKIGDSLRYLCRDSNVFQLAEIDCDGMQILLDFCHQPVQARQIIQSLPGTSLEELQSLVDLQLLLSDITVNIVGEDYFKRTGQRINENGKVYFISERKIRKGSISKNTFKNIPEMVSLLQAILPEPVCQDLKEFKTAFQRKYESRAVPLMVALDPEVGVGYGHLHIIEGEQIPVELENHGKNVATKGVDKLLMRALIRSGMRTIDLESLFAGEDGSEPPLPNTVGVLCSVADDLIVVDQICTPSTNRLTGRFTIAVNGIREMSRNIAKTEAFANPGVLFFDIACNDEREVDNINRRARIYDYLVPILNYENEEGTLNLNDIYVCLREEEIYLYSAKHGKRVVPRLSSAYNYNRSNLAVFRFLCDLQYDGLKSNLNIKLQKYFPGESFYPRLQFRNIVLSPAQWRLSISQLFSQFSDKPSIADLRRYVQNLGFGRYGVTRTEDRTMCFDLEDNEDLYELLHILKKFGSFVLEEGFIPKVSFLKDINGNPYNHQIILTLVNPSKIYDGIQLLRSVEEPLNYPTFYVPADQWLYFEIYLHPLRADRFLTHSIALFVKEHEALISNWFFIRYNDNGEHLRLRVKMREARHAMCLVDKLTGMLKSAMANGIVQDVKICTYKPELDRYGADLIESVEQHFCVDSAYVLSILGSEMPAEDLYKRTMNLFNQVLSNTPWLSETMETLLNQVCSAYRKEFGVTGSGFKELNLKYREIMDTEQGHYTSSEYAAFLKSFISLLKKCPRKRRMQLAIDCFHMHVNRLFATNQRKHEMIIYYFSHKEILRQQAMDRSNSEAIRAES